KQNSCCNPVEPHSTDRRDDSSASFQRNKFTASRASGRKPNGVLHLRQTSASVSTWPLFTAVRRRRGACARPPCNPNAGARLLCAKRTFAAVRLLLFPLPNDQVGFGIGGARERNG